MANERVTNYRNVGTAESPSWAKYFPKTVADAVLMSDSDGEQKNIQQYVDESIAALVDGAPETLDTLNEIAAAISENEDTIEALNQVAANKADKDHTHPDASGSASGFMSPADKSKLDGITAGAEPNQNAFSSVKSGATTFSAGSKTDTFELAAGTGINIAVDAAAKKLTFTASGDMAVSSADKLTTPRTFSITGGATAAGVTFDGTQNVNLNITALNPDALSNPVPQSKLPVASTSAAGIVQLTDSTASTSTTTAATPNSVRTVYSLASSANDQASTAISRADSALESAGQAQATADEAVSSISSIDSKADFAIQSAESKATILFESSLPESAPVNALCFIIS